MKDYAPPPDLLASRVILVTGAGQGLGRAAALSFARHGATVVLHGRKVKKLEKVYDEIEALGAAKPAILPLDLNGAGEAEFSGIADTIAGELGRLDGILHNAAASFEPAPVEFQGLEQWMTAFKVNVAAPVAITRACLPLLRESPDASVLFTSDTHAAAPAAYWGALSASKAALETSVRVLASEWESLVPNLRVNALVPGPVRTPSRARTHPGEGKSRLPAPEDLMPAYLWLMGPAGKGRSGEIITLS